MNALNRKAINPDHRFPEPVDMGFLNGVLTSAGLLSLFTANPVEGVFALIQLKILLRSYWRRNVHPVVLILFLIPWLQISTGILEASIRLITLDEMLHGSGRQAYWLSALGLMFVHWGFFPFFKRNTVDNQDKLQLDAKKFSLSRLIVFYALIGPLSSLLGESLGRGNTLYQLITYFNEISTFLLIIICLRQASIKKIDKYFTAFLIFVFITSFYSFFSDWKTLAFCLFIAFGATQELTRKLAIRTVVFLFFFGNVMFLWQGIKPYYRMYLVGKESNLGGLDTQGVSVNQADALSKFLELSQQFYQGTLTGRKENQQLDNEAIMYSTLRRIGYLEFFSMVLNKVPNELSYENGNLTKENLTFALIPRFLNRNKGVKDDGAKVEKYTGFRVSDSASFSLGHYVEYYIDFGALGMFFPLLLYGILGGGVYQLAHRHVLFRQHPLTQVALAYILLNQWGSFGSDAVYIYGSTFFGLICHLVLYQYPYRILLKVSLAKSRNKKGV